MDINGIIVSIVLSVISSFCYDGIKIIVKQRNKNKSLSVKEYSKQYIRAVKKEFYISLPTGIIFLYFSHTDIEFLNIFNLVMAGFMFLLSLSAFACSVEVINYFSNHDPDKNT